MGAVEEAVIVIQTFTTVGVAMARQLRPIIFQQSMEKKAQGTRVVIRGIEDLVYGQRVQLATESALSPVLQMPGVGPHGQRVPYTSIDFKPGQG